MSQISNYIAIYACTKGPKYIGTIIPIKHPDTDRIIEINDYKS